MRGLLSIDELRNLVEADEIDTVVVGFTDHYGRLHGKRFDAGFYLQDAHSSGTHACDYLLTVDMEMEPVAGYEYAYLDRDMLVLGSVVPLVLPPPPPTWMGIASDQASLPTGSCT